MKREVNFQVIRKLTCGLFTAGSIPLGSPFVNPGSSESSITLDDVVCLGDEQSLLDCDHTPLFMTNCDHSKDAGVSCEGWHMHSY